MNRFKQLNSVLGPKQPNFLSEKIKTTPLQYNPVKLPSAAPLPPPVAAPVEPQAPRMPPVAGPDIHGPPQTNVNSVPKLNTVPQNLSRISKVTKLDHFPRLYHVLKS